MAISFENSVNPIGLLLALQESDSVFEIGMQQDVYLTILKFLELIQVGLSSQSS